MNTHDRFPLVRLQQVQGRLQVHHRVDLVLKVQVWVVVAREDEVER